jgi:hypothetical protein
MIEERTPRQTGTTRRTRPNRPSRARPLSDAAHMRRSTAREAYLGPYETRYDIRDGYGMERPIVRP